MCDNEASGPMSGRDAPTILERSCPPQAPRPDCGGAKQCPGHCRGGPWRPLAEVCQRSAPPPVPERMTDIVSARY
jgi:hypothetical protein